MIQAGQKQQSNGKKYASAGNSVPTNISSSNKDNLYDNFAKSTYNAYLA